MTVEIERTDDILLLGINRPEKRNALDEDMANELRQAFTTTSKDAPRIAVIRSQVDGVFVSGADINELLARNADSALSAINAGLFELIEKYRWPTIAVIDGHALGGGCELAMACDLRIASPRARFGQPELDLGIIAGAGANWRLPQLVGVSMARRMLYAGKILGGEEALQAGLVDEIHESKELLSAALALAKVISKKSWRSLELTKLALSQTRPATTSFDVVAQALLFESDDKDRRMRAFLESRRKRSDS